MPTEVLDPNFYILPQTFGGFEYPRRPLSVVGFTFDRATGVFDFTAVPGFDLARVQQIQLTLKGVPRFLYARPISTPQSLAEVDGAPVPPPPTSGTTFKVKPDTTDLPADVEIIVLYDPPPVG